MSYLQFFDLLLKLCNQALFVLQPAVHLADIIITPKSHRKTLLIIQFNSKIELQLFFYYYFWLGVRHVTFV